MKNMIHPIFGSLSEEELEALKNHTQIHEKNIKKNGSSWVIVGEKHPQPQHLC